jgi:MSHA biogenesis protein MshI
VPFSFPLPFFRKAPRGGVRTGIALGEGTFALSTVRREQGAKPTIEHCATHQVDGDLPGVLKGILEKLHATRTGTCAVIEGEEYQIVQVEAPEVLPSELRAAVRWKLRDAISFNIDEAAVDVFEVPDPVRRTQAKMLFAVAARNSGIQRITSLLKPIMRGFDAIDIPELCLRNLAAVLPQDAKGVAMLAVNENFAQMVVTRQGVMYLTRRVDNARGFNPHTVARSGSTADAGALALELQRSLDYYESHYDQTPIGDLVVAPINDRTRALADELKSETGLRVTVLDVRDVFNVYKSGEVATDWSSLMALGAALRTDAPAEL